MFYTDQIEKPTFSDTNKKLLCCVWRLLQEGNFFRQLIPSLSISSWEGGKEFYLVETGQRTDLKTYNILPAELTVGTLQCLSKVSSYLNLNNFADQV